jgi:hypothetical protein
MEMPAPPRLFNAATGKAVTLPAGVMRLAAPTDGYLPAQQRDSRYSGWWGLLGPDGGWAIAPQTLQSQEPPLRDGEMLAVRRGERWQFVDARGQALSPERYAQVQFVAPGLWLARPDDKSKSVLLDGKQKVLHRFSSDYAGLREEGGWRFMADDDAVLLVGPAGKLQKVAVGQGRVEVRDGQAWISGAQAGNAVPMLRPMPPCRRLPWWMWRARRRPRLPPRRRKPLPRPAAASSARAWCRYMPATASPCWTPPPSPSSAPTASPPSRTTTASAATRPRPRCRWRCCVQRTIRSRWAS